MTPLAATPRTDMPTQPVPTRGRRRSPALPWVIVAIVGILAIVASLFVVNLVQRGDSGGTEGAGAATSKTSNGGGSTSDSAGGGSSPGTSQVTTTTKPSNTTTSPGATTGGSPPKADVGPNPYRMEITYVTPSGIAVSVSQNLGNVDWFYQAGPPQRVMIGSGLMNSFPDSCAAMRAPEGASPWGIEEGANGKWTVVRPAGTCTADPKLYDQVWGLMQAIADSVTPLKP